VIVPEMLAEPVPERWRPQLRREDGRQVVSFRGQELRSLVREACDVERMLAEADEQGVDHLLLSPWIQLVPAGLRPGELAEAVTACRVQNEALARAAAHPRVTALGAVPVHDGGAAAAELTRLMGLPGLRGAEIPCSAGGRSLGDDAFLPFWEAAEASGAIIFVHPSAGGLRIPGLGEYYLWNTVGNPTETAIAAAHLAHSGMLERFPGLRLLLAHGGGTLPSVLGRLARAQAVRPEARSRSAADPVRLLRRLYFDSLTHDPAALARLVAWAGPERVLLGSDRPFDMGSDHPAADITALGLDCEHEALILGGNAARLLGLAG
jgi:aminocarboxymuconate-semialdehyde decarboxylase